MRRQFDRWCDEFESGWQEDSKPPIESFLNQCPPELQIYLLPELLALELDYRLERGEIPSVEEYLQRFSTHHELIEKAFENQAAFCETHRFGSTRDPRLPPIPTPQIRAPQRNLVGTRLGKYELLAELGRGGMGVVYQARQEDLSRLVAVKMLLTGPHAQQQDLEYFRREAEAVARLQHPNIVQVFDVGDHDGLPYFSLEYLERGPLSRQLDGTPQSPSSAAELIATLARALHHAHERGVVHRDLKPGNILLAADGTPKITDFGLAKRLDNQSHTVTGSVLGTPSYMAPEQASGDTRRIGAAADVYGLGAILYELLTGRPPFRGETPWDTVAQVLSDEPVPPTQLQPKVPRDLETICLKCLQKEPGRRYTTAADLAADLARFQAGEPIHARPVNAAERALKWARRHPAVAALGTAFCVAVIAGLAGTTSLWVVASQQRDKAEVTGRRARQEIRDHLIAATEDPAFQRDGAQPARNLVLRRALQYFREYATQRKHDSELAADVADAYLRAGNALAELGDTREAISELTQAAKMYEQLVKAKPKNQDLRYQWASVLLDRATCQAKIGQLTEAEQGIQQAEELFQTVSRASPDNDVVLQTLADARRERGSLQYRQGAYSAALKTLQEARQQYETLRTAEPNMSLEKDLADCLVGIGHVQWQSSRPLDASKSYAAALAIREPWVARQPFPKARAELARNHASLGQAYAELGQNAAALKSFERALQIREDLVRTNPYIIDYQYDLALSCKQVADELQEQGDFPKSLPFRERSVALFAQVLRLNPANVSYANGLAVAHSALAFTYRKGFQRLADAETESHKALGIWQQLQRRKVLAPEQQFALAQGQANLALLHLQADDFATAAAIFETSSTNLQELLRANPKHADYLSQLSINLNNSTYCEQRLGRWAEGLRLCAQCVLIREQLAQQFPQVSEHAPNLAKSRKDLELSATMYMDRAIPLKKDATAEEQQEVETKRRELWKKWSEEIPGIELFQQKLK